MDLQTLRSEFSARGFDYLETSTNDRQNRYLNRAYFAICDTYEWPFLEQDASGTAPLTIADLGKVLSVNNASQSSYALQYIDRRALTGAGLDLTTTGTPEYWYATSQSQIQTYPANTTDTMAVHYVEVPPELTADGDTPLIPSRFHMLIVDLAVVYAYEDSDNQEAAGNAQGLVDRRLDEMRQALLHPNLDTHNYISSTAEHLDA